MLGGRDGGAVVAAAGDPGAAAVAAAAAAAAAALRLSPSAWIRSCFHWCNGPCHFSLQAVIQLFRHVAPMS